MNRIARELVVSQQRLVQAKWRLHEVNVKRLACRNVAIAAQAHVRAHLDPTQPQLPGLLSKHTRLLLQVARLGCHASTCAHDCRHTRQACRCSAWHVAVFHHNTCCWLFRKGTACTSLLAVIHACMYRQDERDCIAAPAAPRAGVCHTSR